MRGRDGGRLADAELVELGHRGVRLHAFGLVDGEPHVGLAAQALRDVAVGAGEARARVDDEDHRVRLGDRLLGLARHLDGKALAGARLEAAGIDGDEAPLAGAALAVMAIARHAGKVVHDRLAAARQAVKEGRFADVRPPDHGEHGLHSARACNAPSCVCTSTPPGNGSGAARTGPPRVA